MKPSPQTPKHECCPKDWRQTPNFTGSHELDAVIHRNNNRDLPARMRMFAGASEPGYGPRTAYNGYSGLSGDD